MISQVRKVGLPPLFGFSIRRPWLMKVATIKTGGGKPTFLTLRLSKKCLTHGR